MKIEVNIFKGGVEVTTLKEPLPKDESLTSLLASLKNAKTKTNEVLTECVEADKKTGVVAKEVATNTKDEINDDDAPIDDEDDQV